MSHVLTLRVRKVAAGIALVAAVALAPIAHTAAWHAMLEPLGSVSGGTDAGLITAPAQ